jgi:GTP-binding protein HflX
LQSLKSSQRKALEKLGERRLRQDVPVTPEFAGQMSRLSRDLNKSIGALVDRRGKVTAVVLGDHRRLFLPDLGRQRAGGSRFRGLRLIRTHLAGDLLSHDDLTDLSKLNLDMVLSLHVEKSGLPGKVAWAHLIPDNPARDIWRTEELDHVNHVNFSFDEFISELENEFEAKRDVAVETAKDSAIIVYVRTRDDWMHKQNLAELHELCRTAEVAVAEEYVQSRMELDPRTAVGSGALEDIELRCLQLGADILVFGQDLTPAQMRTITNRTQLRVIDRTQLILDIFAQRAQSSVGKLQVELAQLKYQLPRLTGKGTAMSRLAGGIGGRGPGETKLEVDRRRARDRITALERGINKLSATRSLRRKNRRDSRIPTIAIVGYTNAGKSTLLNTLTNSTVLSEDKLFATLDPTTRRLRFPEEREVILTDTVGFIRDLPEELKVSFRATLEELDEANLLLHIVDGSDDGHDEHIRSTHALLDELGHDETPRMLVFNKTDRLSAEERANLETGNPHSVMISALTRAGSRKLLEEIDRWLIAYGRSDVVPHGFSADENDADENDDDENDADENDDDENDDDQNDDDENDDDENDDDQNDDDENDADENDDDENDDDENGNLAEGEPARSSRVDPL